MSGELDKLSALVEAAWPPASPLPAGPAGEVARCMPELIAAATHLQWRVTWGFANPVERTAWKRLKAKLVEQPVEEEPAIVPCPSCDEPDGLGRRLYGCDDPDGCGA